ncbi:MAG: hypothetical protein ACYC3V_21140 [Chloroflexota bacterium]
MERAESQYVKPGRKVGTPLPLLVALACGGWLLSARFLTGYLVDALWELRFVLFELLALPAFVWAVLLSVVYLLRAPAAARRVAALLLAVNALALALFLVPMPLIGQMDFQRHHAIRAEVVRRVEAGELWTGSPQQSIAFLPREYPTSVSNAAGQRGFTVCREDGALHVVFYPVTNVLVDERTAIVYRSDGQPPSLASPRLPDTVSSERLGDRWHRVVFAGFGPTFYEGSLQLTLVAVLASSPLAIPLMAAILRLGPRRGDRPPSQASCFRVRG